MACAIAGWYGLSIVRARQQSSRIDALIAASWTPYAIPGSGFSIALPGPPRTQTIDLPPEAKPLTVSASVYRYDAEEVHVAISEAVYAREVRANLEGSIEGALDNMSRQTGGTVTHNRSATEIEGRPAAIEDLQIRSKAENLDGKALFLTDANRAWSVIVLYPPGATSGPKLASKVIESVSLGAK